MCRWPLTLDPPFGWSWKFNDFPVSLCAYSPLTDMECLSESGTVWIGAKENATKSSPCRRQCGSISGWCGTTRLYEIRWRPLSLSADCFCPRQFGAVFCSKKFCFFTVKGECFFVHSPIGAILQYAKIWSVDKSRLGSSYFRNWKYNSGSCCLILKEGYMKLTPYVSFLSLPLSKKQILR